MTPAQLIRWQERMNYSISEAFTALRVGRRAYEKWRAGTTPIPPWIAELTRQLELNKGAKK